MELASANGGRLLFPGRRRTDPAAALLVRGDLFSRQVLSCAEGNSLLLENDRRGVLGGAVDRSLRPSGSRGRSMGIRCEGRPPAAAPEARDDAFYMRRCVDLARRAVGCTSPNPMVGCVIVKGGEVVGEGFHPKAGQPHAEVFALRDAGELAEDATAYVSLEPCNHYGRTPPCTEALIKAKVKRVVVGMVDPNPIVASRGVERLRDSGIDVAVGIEEALCKKLNEAYIHRMLSGSPFVTLRYSLSINGGGMLGHTGRGAKESGGYYSQLLRDYDGVVVSGSSFDEKSTLPASQEVGANQPAIIIIAPKGGPPLHLPASVEASRRMVIFLEDGATVDPETDRNLSQLGIERVVLDELRLTPVLEYCSRQGMCSLLVDFSGDSAGFVEMLGEAGEVGLVQKVVVELCSAWEGRQTAAAAAPLGVIGRPFQLRHLQSWVSKDSVVVEGYIA